MRKHPAGGAAGGEGECVDFTVVETYNEMQARSEP